MTCDDGWMADYAAAAERLRTICGALPEVSERLSHGAPTFFIRGVGLNDYNANAASSVAVYQDEVYMNFPAGQLFQFFDGH